MNTTRSTFERRVRDLCGFGHRSSATAEERNAAIYLLSELQDLSVDSAMEPFFGCRSLAARLLVHIGIAVLGVVFLQSSPIVTVALVSIALASLLAEQRTCGLGLSRLLPQKASQNVVAVVPCKGTPVGRVVLCGHYDTQRTGIIWTLLRIISPLFWVAPRAVQSPLLILGFAMAAEAIVAIITMMHGSGPLITVSAGTLFIFYGGIASLLWDWHTGLPVPGAADNASGAAAVLALTEAWLQEPIEGVELRVLLTGCEEIGLLGSAAWLSEHTDTLKALPTCFLNLDGLGFGSPKFLSQEAPICGSPVRYKKELLAIGRSLQLEKDGEEIDAIALPGPTDGLAFLVRGFAGLTIVGCGKRGELPHYHTPADTVESVDFEAAWHGINLAWRTLRQLSSNLVVSRADCDRPPAIADR